LPNGERDSMIVAPGPWSRHGSPNIRPIRIVQVTIGPREIQAVEQVLKSGRLRAGPVVKDFEARFARHVGTRFAVAVSSGTAALHIAYRAILKPGDEVIVPDFTFVATASMVLAAGGVPVMADVDPETFTLDSRHAERLITRRTRAIAPVHLFGQPAEIERFNRLARRHDFRLIWDAAHAHGARFQGRDLGSFPDVVCYSFYPSKNMTTGEGGMLTTSDPSLASEFKLLRSHGEDRRYHHARLGFNFRMTDVAAAMGRVQLDRLRGAVERRRRHAAILSRGLTGLPGIETPHVSGGVVHAFNVFTLRVYPDVLRMSRDDFQKELARRGIETAVHYPLPLHRQPIFRGCGTDTDFPVSARLAQTVLSLPVHPGLNRNDVERIVRTVREIAMTSSRSSRPFRPEARSR